MQTTHTVKIATSTRRTAVPSTTAVTSKDEKNTNFYNLVCQYIRKINQSPHFLYPKDVTNKGINLSHASTYLPNSGFKYLDTRGIRFDLMYEGSNPGEALDKLLKEPMVILDCVAGLILTQILAYKELIGGNSPFNTFIQHKCAGKVSLFDRSTLEKFCRIEKIHEPKFEILSGNVTKQHLQKGDLVYIFVMNGSVFHPGSELNGHNLICVENQKVSAPLFLGFSSTPTNPMSISEIGKLLEESFQANLTYEDLYLLELLAEYNKDIVENSTMTYAQALEALGKEPANKLKLIAEIQEAKIRCADRTNKKPSYYEASKIFVPTWFYATQFQVHSVYRHTPN